MKFVHIADVHWGMSPDSDKPWSKERSQDIKDTFAKAVAQAGQLEADCLFISGDLFHRQPLARDLKKSIICFLRYPVFTSSSSQAITTASGIIPHS